MIEKLMSLMKEEEEKVRELIKVLKAKRKSIEKNDLNTLDSILKEEENLLNILNTLETERLNVTGELSKKLKVEPTISSLLTYVQEPTRHDLTLLAAKLTELLNEVSLLNLGIQQMIAYRLEEFDVLMDAIRGKKITYDAYEKGEKGTVFNRRA